VDEAVILARLGFVSLCLDASFRRPVKYEPTEEPAQMDLVLIQKNGDSEVEASFTEHEVAISNATGLTYCNVEWKQQPDARRK
jgi:hypothetical protein